MINPKSGIYRAGEMGLADDIEKQELVGFFLWRGKCHSNSNCRYISHHGAALCVFLSAHITAELESDQAYQGQTNFVFFDAVASVRYSNRYL